MSRRAAIVEEFDDDTDLPLPSMPLPNTGTRGPLIQELHISDDEFDPPRAGPASPPRPQQFSQQQSQPFQRPPGPDSSNVNRVTDTTPYKNWTCVYPIYLDAKRPYGTGQRRVERAKSIWWPLSKDIADAAGRLGLSTLHEVNKSHPRDWDNPGRVRVQWKKDGKLMNPIIKTKKQLLEMISFQLQTLKPENVPKPPYTIGVLPTATPELSNPRATSSEGDTSGRSTPTPGSQSHSATQSQSNNKGKTPLKANNKSTASTGNAPTSTTAPSAAPAANRKTGRRRPPIPPSPHPSIGSRVSMYSPLVASGVLIDAVKAGMNAQVAEPGAGGTGVPGQPTGGMGKGKRKVVRVRG